MPGQLGTVICLRIRRAYEAGAPGGSCLGERERERERDRGRGGGRERGRMTNDVCVEFIAVWLTNGVLLL